MTGPAPDAKPPAGPDGGNPPAGPDDKSKKGPAPAPDPAGVDLLAVVQFKRVNPVTRREHRGVGVVIAVDDQSVTVAPVHHGHHLRLAPDEVVVVAADDIDED